MSNSTIKQFRLLPRLLAAATAIGIIVTGTNAVAGVVDGHVSVVEYSPGNLLIQIAEVTNTNFFAYTSVGAPCEQYARTIDTIKVWVSLAQAALLSGKSVRLYSENCGSVDYITVLDLNSK